MSPLALRTPALWLCADVTALCASELVARVRAVLAVVPARVWLRPAPETPSGALLSLARELVREGAPVIVGDRLDVAIASGALGVHLAGRSVSALDARRLWAVARPLDPAPVVSAAVHDAYALRAMAERCDALLLSPFAHVAGKGAALGPGRFAALRALAPGRDVVALGGVLTERDAAAAAHAGASAVAVRRALLGSSDPAASCGALFAAFCAARTLDARAAR